MKVFQFLCHVLYCFWVLTSLLTYSKACAFHKHLIITCDYRQNSYKTPSKSNKVVATTTEKSFNDRVLLGPEVIVNCGVTHLDGPLTSCWGLMLIIVCLLLSFSLRADCYYLICCLMVNGMFSHWCGIFGKVRICAPVKKFKMKDFGYYQICNLHNISTTTITHTKRVTLTYLHLFVYCPCHSVSCLYSSSQGYYNGHDLEIYFLIPVQFGVLLSALLCLLNLFIVYCFVQKCG